MRYLEAVTVCVNYSDFLREVIPYNLPMIDRWIIVTTPEDRATRDLCRQFGLYCLQTRDGITPEGFAKGAMIERGLQHTAASGWRMHIDADIALPRHFRMLLDMAELQTDTIYGVDRVVLRSWNEWQEFKKTGYLDGNQYAWSHAVRFPEGRAIGNRWASTLTGWVPIGFLQLWHSSEDEWHGIRTKPYPEKHNSACRTDVQHGLQWDRNKRELLPEVIVVHLESEPCEKGKNWNGRQTKPFGPGVAVIDTSGASG
jgi:hypothetical protein